jgi:hypothetical protein
MTPPPNDAAVPDPAMADPMLRVLRERHPEVDVVVLPGPVPPASDTPRLDPAGLTAMAQGSDALVGDLLAQLSRETAWTGAERFSRWHTDEWGRAWYESGAVVGDLAEGDNIALLRATGAALVDLGWRARPVPGDRPRLEARRGSGADSVTASATVRPTELVLITRTLRVLTGEEVVR